MRKSQKLLIFSYLCLFLLAYVCLICILPNNFACNVIRILFIILGIISYLLYIYQDNKEVTISFEKELNMLKENYKDLNSLVESYTNNVYNSLDSNFVKNCYLSINNTDDYLIYYSQNLKYYSQKLLKVKTSNNNELVSSNFIDAACLMDSLVSTWKIEPEILLDEEEIRKLLIVNCELAISVTFHLMDLSYENLKNNIYVTKLLRLLVIYYLEKDCGKFSTIECEKTVLELIYSELHTKSD